MPRDDSNDFRPMWVGGKVYFLSDRDGPVTLFAYDPGTKSVARGARTRHRHQVRLRRADAIVYEQFGGLHLYDLKSGRLEPVTVSVSADLAGCATVRQGAQADHERLDLSPTGARAVFEARGEILTVPGREGRRAQPDQHARRGRPRPGVVARRQVVAYFSDESGEYELHIASAGRPGRDAQDSLGEPTFYRAALVARQQEDRLHRQAPELWYIDLDSGKSTKVDTDR